VKSKSDYFDDYCRMYTDMPFLVRMDERRMAHYVPERMMRASDLADNRRTGNNPDWKTLSLCEATRESHRAKWHHRLALGRRKANGILSRKTK
jgi:nitrate reductase alpha subunit